MHMAGPAPSGDFWFLLVASKGTRRRQGIWENVDLGFSFVHSCETVFPRQHVGNHKGCPYKYNTGADIGRLI